MSASLSILGLYNFDPTIFANMNLPAGIDKNTVINNILLECAEFEILYPDPGFMKFAIETWSKKNYPVWKSLYDTTTYDYDPIYNYDRKEEYTDTEKDSASSVRKPDLIDETTHGMTTTQSQNSFENAGFVPALKSENGGKDSNTRKGTEELTNTGDKTITHTARMYGNIGVTTTQQMIEQERNISEFNIYDRIITDFKMRFCLLVY